MIATIFQDGVIISKGLEVDGEIRVGFGGGIFGSLEGPWFALGPDVCVHASGSAGVPSTGLIGLCTGVLP